MALEVCAYINFQYISLEFYFTWYHKWACLVNAWRNHATSPQYYLSSDLIIQSMWFVMRAKPLLNPRETILWLRKRSWQWLRISSILGSTSSILHLLSQPIMVHLHGCSCSKSLRGSLQDDWRYLNFIAQTASITMLMQVFSVARRKNPPKDSVVAWKLSDLNITPKLWQLT